MSTDRRLRRALALVTLGLAGVLAAAVPAAAQESPAEPIVAGLRQSPVYIHPALSSAVPATDQQQLADAIRKGSVAIHIVIVPLIRGDAWGGNPEALATVVRDRLGEDGVYITLSDYGGNDKLAAFEWPSDQHQARYAAWATGFEDNLRQSGLTPKLARAIELIQAGTGHDAYEAASNRYSRPSGASPSPGGGRDDGDDDKQRWVLPLLGLAVVGVGALSLFQGRRRRSGGGFGPRFGSRFGRADSFRLPRKVFVAARQADEDELRARASAEVVTFGELLDHEDFKPAEPAAQADLQRALDAYLAAGKVSDAATRATDWVGALVLVDLGRDAYAAARAREAGEPVTPPTGLCFFNPLHGDSVRTVDFRPIGQRPRLQAPACSTCAKAVAERRAPEVLTDRVDGHDVPYFEVDSDRSVWAATGYGALRDDLVPRILRGDLRRSDDRRDS